MHVCTFTEIMSQLTPQERRFVAIIKAEPGLKLRAVGQKLGDITEHGAKFHRDNVFRKFQVNSRAELVAKLCEKRG